MSVPIWLGPRDLGMPIPSGRSVSDCEGWVSLFGFLFGLAGQWVSPGQDAFKKWMYWFEPFRKWVS